MTSGAIIELVEQHPAIWDKRSDIYKDKFEKEKAWLAVARGLHQDWDKLSKEGQNKKLNGFKNKWRNMKDAMIKSLQSKSGGAAKKKKYVHFDALSFLLTAGEKRSTGGNYDDDYSSQEEECEEASLTHDDRSSSPTSQSSVGASERALFKKPTQPAKTIPPLMNSIEQPAISLSKSPAPEDADRLYLLSILPDYKNLNQSQKWEFRQHVAHFFLNAYQAEPRSLSNVLFDSRTPTVDSSSTTTIPDSKYFLFTNHLPPNHHQSSS
ncbi:hypothetical protein GE061_009762 [Apolygus lucorum]|uniref:MADF domain-containing protein n=1 Tax=Apolygus lucorum TaxID=248454 RepID=A0A8S9Y2H5_APOLU|nr:hypothetical protein GE061_009762 [Apolygus lucorum]